VKISNFTPICLILEETGFLKLLHIQFMKIVSRMLNVFCQKKEYSWEKITRMCARYKGRLREEVLTKRVPSFSDISENSFRRWKKVRNNNMDLEVCHEIDKHDYCC